MKNLANSNATPLLHPVKVKREWKRPVLDILKVESAEVGRFTINDGVGHHKSGN
jgi:hypothetical protein